MKSKTSCFNKTIFKKNITHFWPIWLFILLWNLFVLPFSIYENYVDIENSSLSVSAIEDYKNVQMANLVNIYFNPVWLFILSVIVVMAVFSYLYNSRSANTIHALPVTRKELFITNYLSGLTFLWLPEMIGFILGILVSAVCGYSNLSYLLQGLLFALGISFFFYSFAVFIGMFTGQLFALPFFTLVINLLFVGEKAIGSQLVACLSYGMTGTYQQSKLDILSPLYCLTSYVGAAYDYSTENAVFEGFTGSSYVIGYSTAAIFLVIGAYGVYKRKNMETVGDLISISIIKPVFRWGVGICGATLFSLFFCALLGFHSAKREFVIAVLMMILFGAVFFFGAEMFLEKGFRVFNRKRFTECGIFLIILVMGVLGIEFNLFGQESRIPEASEVEKAYVRTVYPAGGSQESQIEEIIKIHQQLIDSKKEFEAFAAKNRKEEDLKSVSIKYFLKNGSVLYRDYDFPATEEERADSNSVYSALQKMTGTPDSYLENAFGYNYKEVSIKSGYVDLFDKSGTFCRSHELNEEESKKLYEAFLTDLKEGKLTNEEMNNYPYSKEYEENIYYTNFTFNYYCEDGVVDIYDNYNSDISSNRRYINQESKTGTATVEFNTGCKNIIQTLLDIGVIENEKDLVTIKQVNENAQ